jgi:hypothetical protein
MSNEDMVFIMCAISFAGIIAWGFILLTPKKKCKCIRAGMGNILARKVSELYCPQHGDPKLLKEQAEKEKK